MFKLQIFAYTQCFVIIKKGEIVDPLMDFDEYKTLEYNSIYLNNLIEDFMYFIRNIVKKCLGKFP